MTDISKLLEWYQVFANEANSQNKDDRIKKMLKRHIRELACEGGPGGTGLRKADSNGICEESGWILCCDGNCVPPEVGC